MTRARAGARATSTSLRLEPAPAADPPGDRPRALRAARTRRSREHLLGTTVVVDDLADAVELHSDRPGRLPLRHARRRSARSRRHAPRRPADGGDGPAVAPLGARSDRPADRRRRSPHRAAHRRSSPRATPPPRSSQEQSRTRCATTIYKSNTAKVELTSQIAQTGDQQSSLQREQPVLERELADVARAGRQAEDRRGRRSPSSGRRWRPTGRAGSSRSRS